MPTNDERRRVAEALREMEKPTWPTLTDAVMGHVATREKAVERLADLIDRTSEVISAVEFEAYYTWWDFNLSCGHGFDWPWREPPAYCPICGRRIEHGDRLREAASCGGAARVRIMG